MGLARTAVIQNWGRCPSQCCSVSPRWGCPSPDAPKTALYLHQTSNIYHLRKVFQDSISAWSTWNSGRGKSSQYLCPSVRFWGSGDHQLNSCCCCYLPIVWSVSQGTEQFRLLQQGSPRAIKGSVPLAIAATAVKKIIQLVLWTRYCALWVSLEHSVCERKPRVGQGGNDPILLLSRMGRACTASNQSRGEAAARSKLKPFPCVTESYSVTIFT